MVRSLDDLNMIHKSGDIVGDYTLLHKLGVGGMGEVWLAHHEAIGGAERDVAIKFLSAETSDQINLRKMFFDEARLSMLLHNSNIVQVYNVAENDDDTCYMVMEFVDGMNLSELCTKMRAVGESMPDKLTAYIIGEVLKGLAHAHDCRHRGRKHVIVHRDVSPHNVMLSVSGEVKIMDFGIARLSTEETTGTIIKGKLRYMPPEQLSHETREPTLDLFAVGAMLHELLDGRNFRAGAVDHSRLIGMVVHAEIPPLERDEGTIPPEINALRLALLAKEPKDRIQSARTAFLELSAWPGYRDTRFELEDLVRRYVFGEERETHLAPASAVCPNPMTGVGASGRADMIATKIWAAGGREETDVARARGSTTGARPAPIDDSRHGRARALRAVLLVLAGLGIAGLGLSAVMGVWGDETRIDETQQAQAQGSIKTTDEQLAKAARAASDSGEEPSAGGPPPPPDLGAPASEPPPAGDSPGQRSKAGAASPPSDGRDGGGKKTSKPAPVIRHDVKLTLARGVPYAEIKLGGRKVVLDPLTTSSASVSVREGRQTMRYRLQFDGAWKKKSVTISDKATVQITKGGKVLVK